MTPCDTGPLVALVDRRDANHAACVAAIHRLASGPLMTTWPCFTEAMHLGYRNGGYRAQEALWQLRASGRLAFHQPAAWEVDRMVALMAKYRDLPMDLADASLVAMSEAFGVQTVFTLDRHFHAYRLIDGSALNVVP